MFFSKLYLSGKPWIRFTQYSMTVSGNNLALTQCFFYISNYLFLRREFCIQFFAKLQDPLDHFLVGESVQWSRQAIHTGSETQVRITQSRAHEMSCICTDIPPFMIRVYGHIQSHEFMKSFIFITQHMSKIA